MDKFFDFLPIDNTLIMVILAIIVLIFIVSLIKSLFRIALFIGLIGLVAVIFFGVAPDDLFKKGEEIATTSISYLKQTVKPVIESELKKAHYRKNDNGSVEFYTEKMSILKLSNGDITGKVNTLNISLSNEEMNKMFSEEELKNLLEKFKSKQG